MYTLQLTFSDRPEWQRQVRARLAVSMCMALLLLAAVLLLPKFSPLPISQDGKIELRLLADIERPPAKTEELVEPETLVEPVERKELVERSGPAESVEASEPIEAQVRDWYSYMERAVQETVAAANHVDSMHPAFGEKRRLAAINFRASRAVVEKPIWENVESDQMGRTILRSGDCYRVLEDWRVTQYDFHRDFGQYITYCDHYEKQTMDVAWVDEIRESYAYLNYRDGEISSGIVVE